MSCVLLSVLPYSLKSLVYLFDILCVCCVEKVVPAVEQIIQCHKKQHKLCIRMMFSKEIIFNNKLIENIFLQMHHSCFH